MLAIVCAVTFGWLIGSPYTFNPKSTDMPTLRSSVVQGSGLFAPSVHTTWIWPAPPRPCTARPVTSRLAGLLIVTCVLESIVWMIVLTGTPTPRIRIPTSRPDVSASPVTRGEPCVIVPVSTVSSPPRGTYAPRNGSSLTWAILSASSSVATSSLVFQLTASTRRWPSAISSCASGKNGSVSGYRSPRRSVAYPPKQSWRRSRPRVSPTSSDQGIVTLPVRRTGLSRSIVTSPSDTGTSTGTVSPGNKSSHVETIRCESRRLARKRGLAGLIRPRAARRRRRRAPRCRSRTGRRHTFRRRP